MKRKALKILPAILVLLTAVLIVIWQIFLSETTSVYLISAIILLISMIPFLLTFERSAPSARELALLAVLISLAVASRAVFYLVPQFKPIAAVVIASAVCLGAERGYIIGTFSAFVSNFIFGQGIWTPFQMVALGLVGFLAGIIFKIIKPNRWSLSIVGFILAFVLYGIIADSSSVLIMVSDFNLESVLAVYGAGVPFSAIFGGATAVFLFLFGEGFIKKLDRINTKYGIVKTKENGNGK
ncbi:MAG: ECF transporter S component [Eubacterium sp.]|nr:ECF transporter S component [Eubacterium sp.]